MTEKEIHQGYYGLFSSEAQICMKMPLVLTNDFQVIIWGHDLSDRVATIVTFFFNYIFKYGF